jgi:hypothetical protein
MPTFSFMTGASTYRCQAASKAEVLQIARASLNPTPDMMAVIENTLYEEGEAAAYVEQVPVSQDASDYEEIDESVPYAEERTTETSRP